MRSAWEARKKIIGIGAIFLLVLFMVNLNSRLSEYFHLSSERDKLAVQVANLSATKAALETQVAYAKSDQAVEDWARNEAHLALPGDQVIVPLTPAGQTFVPQVETTPAPQMVENWEVWWALFFSE